MDKELSLKEILLEEPRLLDLMNDGFKFSQHEQDFWKKSEYWYKCLKPKMLKLVGFQAENRNLKDCLTYDEIYMFFVKLMDM